MVKAMAHQFPKTEKSVAAQSEYKAANIQHVTERAGTVGSPLERHRLNSCANQSGIEDEQQSERVPDTAW